MAVIRTRADDVLLSTRGQTVEATRERKLTLPKEATGDKRSLRVTLDVSDQGERELNALIKKAQEDTVKAWAPVLAIARKRLGPKGGNARPKKAASEPEEAPASAPAPSEDGFPAPAQFGGESQG